MDVQEKRTVLGRFGHHDNPVRDFVQEVDEIDASDDAGEARLVRIQTAMQFRVGGDMDAIDAKARLRRIEDEILQRRKRSERIALEADLEKFLSGRADRLGGRTEDLRDAAREILDFLDGRRG